MTQTQTTYAGPAAHADAPPVAAAEGWAKAAGLAGDVIGLLAIGLLVPIAILVVGAPVALAVRLVLWMFGSS